jgi:protein-disulfide isomerase
VPAIDERNPSRGPASAPVILQVFSDFECPFCVRVAPTLARIEQRYRGRLRLVWRNFPLPSHARARPAARVVMAAFEAGGATKFWQLHDWLVSPHADLSEAGLRRAAASLGLPAARIEQALSGAGYDQPIDADMLAADVAGVEVTPTVFVNDYAVVGARSEAEYRVVVERALREAGK